MALPASIKTATLSFGSAVNVLGVPKPISVEVTPVFGGDTYVIVHAASGSLISKETISGTAGGGEVVNMEVPIDQAGFRTVGGAMITVGSIAYRCVVRVSGMESYVRLVHPTIEGQLIDVDLIPDAAGVLKQLGSIPLVTSVNGMTGDVTVSAGAGGGDGTGTDLSGVNASLTALNGRVTTLEGRTVPVGVPTGGTDGQVLTAKADGSRAWQTPPSGVVTVQSYADASAQPVGTVVISLSGA